MTAPASPETIRDFQDVMKLMRLDFGARARVYSGKQKRWITRSRLINSMDLWDHLAGHSTVGFVTRGPMVDLVAIDIDAHGDMDENIRWHELAQGYRRVTRLLGLPSFVCRTHRSGGLHLYYKVDRPAYFQTMRDRLKILFDEETIVDRIGPTPRHDDSEGACFRFPFNVEHGGMFLDPLDLRPLDITGPEAGIAYLQDRLRNEVRRLEDFLAIPDGKYRQYRTKKLSKKRKQNLQRVGRIERESLKLIQGNSNNFLPAIVHELKTAGFRPDSVVEKVEDIVSRAEREGRFVRHEDMRKERLEARVRHYLKTHDGRKTNGRRRGREHQPNLPVFTEYVVDLMELAVVEYFGEWTGAPHVRALRRKAFREFATNLALHVPRVLTEGKTARQLREAKHNRTRHLLAQGYIPLPKEILTRLKDRYPIHLEKLVATGIAIPYAGTIGRGGGGYRKGRGEQAGYCRHYWIKWLSERPRI